MVLFRSLDLIVSFLREGILESLRPEIPKKSSTFSNSVYTWNFLGKRYCIAAEAGIPVCRVWRVHGRDFFTKILCACRFWTSSFVHYFENKGIKDLAREHGTALLVCMHKISSRTAILCRLAETATFFRECLNSVLNQMPYYNKKWQ